MRGRLLTVVIVFLVLGADDPKEEVVKQEMAKFQGTWTAISQTGERDLPPGLKIEKVVIKGTEMTLVMQKLNSVAEFTINPSKSPKEIDRKLSEGPSKGHVLLGIYELDGDNLKLCYNTASGVKDRPTEFKDERLNLIRIVVLKREKP